MALSNKEVVGETLGRGFDPNGLEGTLAVAFVDTRKLRSRV